MCNVILLMDFTNILKASLNSTSVANVQLDVLHVKVKLSAHSVMQATLLIPQARNSFVN